MQSAIPFGQFINDHYLKDSNVRVFQRPDNQVSLVIAEAGRTLGFHSIKMMKFGLLDRSIRLLAAVRPGFWPFLSGAMGGSRRLVE